jgi:hypothetical protein
MLEVGSIYAFHGAFEKGRMMIGVYEGSSDGFVQFKQLVNKADLQDCMRGDNVSQIEKLQEVTRDEAAEIYKKFEHQEIIEPPAALIARNRAFYNFNQVNTFIPMKNYWREADV